MGSATYNLKELDALVKKVSAGDLEAGKLPIEKLWLPVFIGDNSKKQHGQIQVEISFYPHVKDLIHNDHSDIVNLGSPLLSRAETVTKPISEQGSNIVPSAPELISDANKMPKCQTGILQVHFHEIEIDETVFKGIISPNKSQIPACYFEIFDLNGTLSSNFESDLAAEAEISSNQGKKVPRDFEY